MEATNKQERNIKIINKNTPILFCNIGWMKYYNGSTDDDYILGDDGNSDEIYNFQNNNGKCYGYVEVKDAGAMNLKKIDSSILSDTDKIEGVLVVWFSSMPKNGGSYIVGWYKDATVYRNHIEPKDAIRRNRWYNIEADFLNCTLLPENGRIKSVPRNQKGFPGRTHHWFADTEYARSFREETIQYINSYTKESEVSRHTHSYKPDVELNKKIEAAAVKSVTELYEKRGYTVCSVEKENKGWDLEATHNGEKLLLEVKGKGGSDIFVRISGNEYAQMQNVEKNSNYRLCVVLNATTNPEICVFLLNQDGTKWICEQDTNIQLKIETAAVIAIVEE